MKPRRLFARVPFLGCLLALSGITLIAGCGKDEIATIPQPPDVVFPGSPDALIDNFRWAYEEMDGATYAVCIHPDFKFILHEDDVSSQELPTNYLNRAEEIQIATSMFLANLSHPRFDFPVPISNIWIDVLKPAGGDWVVAEEDPDFAGFLSRTYDLEMNVELVDGLLYAVHGQQTFFVSSRDSLQPDGSNRPFFQLVGQRDLTENEKPVVTRSWGYLKLIYQENIWPVATFQFSSLPSDADPAFRFDAGDSYDPDSGLHAEPYRWKPLPGGDWTEWSADPTLSWSYTGLPGDWEVILQVRDRWDSTAANSQTLFVPVVFPDSREKALANFQMAYRSMDVSSYIRGLSTGYRFYFQPEDIEKYLLPGPYLNLAQERQVTLNLFSGDPIDPNPGITGINLSPFDPLSSWFISDHPDFPYSYQRVYDVDILLSRGEAAPLQVFGPQGFYVASRDSVLLDENVREIWEVVGQVDRTHRAPEPSADSIGLFFDPEATLSCVDLYGPGPILAYLAIIEPSAAGGVFGWECSLAFEPCFNVSHWDMQGEAINANSPPDFTVGLRNPLPWANVVVLMEINAFITCNHCLNLYVRPASQSSIPGHPAYVDGGDFNQVIPLVPVSGSIDSPVARINCLCPPPPSSYVTWGALKALYQ